MVELLQKLFYLILQLFGRVENHTKPPELDGGAPDEVVDKPAPEGSKVAPGDLPLAPAWLRPPAPPDAPKPKETAWDVVSEILERPFKSPLADIPTRRYPLTDASGKLLEHGVYSVYGRAPKDTKVMGWRKASLKVHAGLPGKWNNGKARLYMEKSVGEHFREGLARAGEMEKRLSELAGERCEVLSYIHKVGSYSHRHIRHNPHNELSYHSWAIAFDQNPVENRGVAYAKSWQKRGKKNGATTWIDCGMHEAQRGPVNTVLPFSKQFYQLFPKGLPFELCMAFKSVHFVWGGDWGRSKWHKVVERFGPGYDQKDPAVADSSEYKAAMKEWDSMRYYDGMHMELVLRGEWAAAHYERMRKRVIG